MVIRAVVNRSRFEWYEVMLRSRLDNVIIPSTKYLLQRDIDDNRYDYFKLQAMEQFLSATRTCMSRWSIMGVRFW